jgi:hypothetical protein
VQADSGASKVLCYVRPWSTDQFRRLAEGTFPGATITYASDFRDLGELPISARFYALVDQPDVTELAAPLLDAAEFDDIRKRCRLLRSIPEGKARRMLAAMAVALNEALDRTKPDFVLSYAVDSYVLDLLLHLAQRRGAEYIGLAAIFVNGYYRVTARGEYRSLRTADENEIQPVLSNLLRDEYKPIYITVGPHGLGTQRLAYYRGVERWAKNIARFVYFQLKRLAGSDHLGYHEYSSRVVSSGWLQALPTLRWTKDWARRIEAHKGLVFYVPLQWTPESSIDYWCPNLAAIDYDERIFEICSQLARRGIVVVKEHPAFWGYRPRRFYSRLRKIPNVVVAAPNSHSLPIVGRADMIVVYTGSVGFESALRGKNVAALGDPYYRSGRFIHYLDDANHVLAFLDEHAAERPIDAEEQKAMARHVLAGALPGRFRDDGSYDDSVPSHREEIEAVAQALHGYLWRKGTSQPAGAQEQAS